MAGNMERTRKWYGVPAKRGGRVVYTGCGKKEFGTIRSAKDCRLNIRLDGHKHTMPFHPTWELEYLPCEARQTRQSEGEGNELRPPQAARQRA